MKIFKIRKVYMVPASSKAEAMSLVDDAPAVEMLRVSQGVSELPELAAGNKPASDWLAEFKRQLGF